MELLAAYYLLVVCAALYILAEAAWLKTLVS